MNRRDFLKAGLATLAVLTIPGDSAPLPNKTRAQRLFGRDGKVEVNESPKIYYDEKSYFPSRQEIELYSKQTLRLSRLKGKPPKQRSYSNNATIKQIIELESDKDYAKRYATQSKISINHAKEFFGFPELGGIDYNFVLPKNESEIKLSSDRLNIYLLRDLIERKSLKYDLKTSEGDSFDIWISGDMAIAGQVITDLKPEYKNKKFILDNEFNSAVLLNIGPKTVLEQLVDSPVLEFIHQGFSKVKNNQFNQNTSTIIPSDGNFQKIYNILQNRGESFVHALGFLWLEQYNKDRNLGFNEEELENRVTKLDKKGADVYKGTAKVFERIRKIGIQEARKTYIENPEELFKGIN